MLRLRIRPCSALTVVTFFLNGCAIPVRPPEPDYRLSAGRIGIAVESLEPEDVPTAGNYAGKGALGGAFAPLSLVYLGPAGLAAGILLSPFTAAYGAAKAGSCGQKFTDAYPPLADKIGDIVEREFRRADIADVLAVELRKHTSTYVTTLEMPPPAGDEDHTRKLLSTASQGDLGYVFVIKPTIHIKPTGDKCEQGKIGVQFKVTLWNVAEARPIGLRPKLSAWRGQDVTVAFNDLATLLDEPAALRSRFMPLFESWASDLYYHGGFDLPQ